MPRCNGHHGLDSTQKRLADCQRVIGYFFADPTLLETALTHSSLRSPDRECNERLEFLGDSVLGLVITEELYHLLPDSAEGEMTRVKSAVVSRKSLYRASTQLGLPEFAEYARGVGRKDELPTSVVANLVESVIGAIYLDAGYYPAREFVLRHLGDEVDDVLNDRGAKNHKSLLQHEVQQNTGVTPHYRTVEEEGPDHDKIFVVAAIIHGREWGRASGANKKDAEQEAARMALEAWARRGRGRRRRERADEDELPVKESKKDKKSRAKGEKKKDAEKSPRKAEKKKDGKAKKQDGEKSEKKRKKSRRKDEERAEEQPAKAEAPRKDVVAAPAASDEPAPPRKPRRRSRSADEPRVKAAAKAKRPARRKRGDAARRRAAEGPDATPPAKRESQPAAERAPASKPEPAPAPALTPAPAAETSSRKSAPKPPKRPKPAPLPPERPKPAATDFGAGILDGTAEPEAQSQKSTLLPSSDEADLKAAARAKAPKTKRPKSEDGFAI